MATPLAAASAYASVARIASESNSLALVRDPAAAATGDTSFAAVLKEAIGSVAEMGRKSDA
jgi:flagellar hook-basal body complex protein FliE